MARFHLELLLSGHLEQLVIFHCKHKHCTLPVCIILALLRIFERPNRLIEMLHREFEDLCQSGLVTRRTLIGPSKYLERKALPGPLKRKLPYQLPVQRLMSFEHYDVLHVLLLIQLPRRQELRPVLEDTHVGLLSKEGGREGSCRCEVLIEARFMSEEDLEALTMPGNRSVVYRRCSTAYLPRLNAYTSRDQTRTGGACTGSPQSGSTVSSGSVWSF